MVAESRAKVLHQINEPWPFDGLVWNYTETNNWSLVAARSQYNHLIFSRAAIDITFHHPNVPLFATPYRVMFPSHMYVIKSRWNAALQTEPLHLNANKNVGDSLTCDIIHTLWLKCILTQGTSDSHQLCFKIHLHRPSASLWIAHEAESWVTRLRGLRALAEWDNVEWRWLVLVLAAGDGGNDVVVMMAVMATVMCGTSYCWRLDGGSEVFIWRDLEFSICV